MNKIFRRGKRDSVLRRIRNRVQANNHWQLFEYMCANLAGPEHLAEWFATYNQVIEDNTGFTAAMHNLDYDYIKSLL